MDERSKIQVELDALELELAEEVLRADQRLLDGLIEVSHVPELAVWAEQWREPTAKARARVLELRAAAERRK